MRIAIQGAGVAGPTLAWWLRRYGHDPVLLEKAPSLRTGGYVIDFWGVGYDIAEKMGILGALHEQGYAMQELRMVDERGEPTARLGVETFRALTDGRYLSIARGDLAATIHRACEGIETRFGTTITALEDRGDAVDVSLSDGGRDRFDLVVGADGLHSGVRALQLGPEEKFERFLGFQVAVFTAPAYRPRDELTFVCHTLPGRHLARIALHGDDTAFLFIWRTDRDGGGPESPTTDEEKRRVLRDVFRDMGWEAHAVLRRLDEADGIYFDRVSQIRMDAWTRGRVALVGDAAACVSLLAGEGTGLAILEAYVLAGELERAGGDYAAAFAAYESRLRPFLAKKQETATRFAGFFAPKTRLALAVRDLLVRVSSVPFLAKTFVGPSLRDDIELPEYGERAGVEGQSSAHA